MLRLADDVSCSCEGKASVEWRLMFGRSSAAAVWVELAEDAIHDSDWTSPPGKLGTQIGSFEVRR